MNVTLLSAMVAFVRLASLLISGPVTLLAQQTDAGGIRRDLDTFIARAMATGLTPGMAVSVVRGSDVIYAKGFGFADRESNRRVTADTQFYIASTTKSFTALAGALLAARGVIDLDAPLSQYLPNVTLDPALSPDAISLRDLLTHTHGIRSGGPVDFRTAFTGDFTNAQLMDLLKLHPPAPSGRSFSYSNLGYNIFSLVLDAKLKEGWKHVIQREVFDPIGMRSTTANMSKANPSRLALPYNFGTTAPERVYYGKRDENMQAAGGHLSSANDLARYLEAHLNQGRVNGRQVLPAAPIEETHRQQVVQTRTFGPFQRFGWGLGWDLATYEGDTILQRFGDFSGFRSHVSFMPEQRLGVVVLTNGGGASSPLSDLVATYVYDRLLGKPGLSARYDERLASTQEDVRTARTRERTTRGARPQITPLPLSAYAGTYDGPALGRMIWTFEAGRLNVTMGIARGDVEVYDGTKYQLRLDLGGAGAVVTFDVPNGAQRPVGLRFLDYVFTRVQEK